MQLCTGVHSQGPHPSKPGAGGERLLLPQVDVFYFAHDSNKPDCVAAQNSRKAADREGDGTGALQAARSRGGQGSETLEQARGPEKV